MLCNAVQKASFQSSPLIRSAGPSVVAAAGHVCLLSLSSNLRSSPQHSSRLPFRPNSVRFSSSWGRSGLRSNSNSGVHASASASAIRPTVNGKRVAFHIKDLTAAAITHDSSTMVQKREYDSNLIVILDMDECLIHSQFLSPAAQQYAHQLLHQQRRRLPEHSKAVVDSFRFNLPDGDSVHVHIRPGLPDFLRRVTERFETHIFTAAMPLYANPVLDKLDPEGTMFAGRWFRDSCTFDSCGAYVKNLNRLPIVSHDNLHRVVLVDNNPLSFLANPSNGILVNSFYTDPTDKTLPAVWELLQELDEHGEDVRPILQERFALHQTLNKVRCNTAAVAAVEPCFEQATLAAV